MKRKRKTSAAGRQRAPAKRRDIRGERGLDVEPDPGSAESAEEVG